MRNTPRYTLADFHAEVVPAAELRALYPRIEPGLHEVAANSRDDWIPADIYLALVSGGAHLSVGYVAGEIAAFAVTREMSSFVGRTMFIWATWVAPEWRGHKMFRTAETWLAEQAKSCGYEYIELTTSSPETAKKCEAAGFDLVFYMMRKEI